MQLLRLLPVGFPDTWESVPVLTQAATFFSAANL